MLHFNGTARSQTAIGTIADLTWIWGISASSVYVTAEDGTVYHYDGAVWSAIDTGANALYSISGDSDTNLIAVGPGGAIFHYNGSTWAPATSPTSSDLNAVWVVDSQAAFGCGADGVVAKYDGIRWTQATVKPLVSFGAVWGSSASDLFVVGEGGTIFHSNGRILSPMSNSSDSYLTAV